MGQSGKDRRVRVKIKFQAFAAVMRLMYFLNFKSTKMGRKISGKRLYDICDELDHKSRRQGNSPEKRYKNKNHWSY